MIVLSGEGTSNVPMGGGGRGRYSARAVGGTQESLRNEYRDHVQGAGTSTVHRGKVICEYRRSRGRYTYSTDGRGNLDYRRSDGRYTYSAEGQVLVQYRRSGGKVNRRAIVRRVH